MKIKNLKLNNFAKFTEFECEFNGNITHLVGVNGAGKTTIGLTAIWAALKGIAEKSKDGQLIGERFRFIGPAKATADVEITLLDEKKNVEVKVKNHISKANNQITFEGPEGYPLSNDWLNNLLSVAFLSAKNFTQLPGKEQSLLLGINTEKYDLEIKELKEDFTLLNKEYRNLGDMEPVEKVDPVNIVDLYTQKEKIVEYNNAQKAKGEKIDKANEKLEELRDEKEELEEKLRLINGRIKDGEEYLRALPEMEKPKPTDEIQKKINNATETNEEAEKYKSYQEHIEKKKESKSRLDQNKSKQEQKEQERLNYIKSFDFGFDGLSVDDKGGLLLHGKPIKEPYFSKGELEIIVAKLYTAQEPELKVRFIDDFELLDEDNQEKIVKDLTKAGFQIITAEVGKESVKQNSILLRECKKVNNYSEQKTLL